MASKPFYMKDTVVCGKCEGQPTCPGGVGCVLGNPTPPDEYPVQGARPVIVEAPPVRTAADILDSMAETFRERNKVYGSNYKMVAPLVRALFPNGVPPDLVVTHQWHLFELKLVKLSRFAISNLTHVDSIHDDGVYSAMIESIITNQENDK